MSGKRQAMESGESECLIRIAAVALRHISAYWSAKITS
jgi:hypothetical protein